ncbi:MAG: hypothetical protein CM15mP29_0850 [Alphaproteobacteria bacterium]|nr:MAG: hypothetical protein CM15mP29_0850 [Alphaproteobacteria bacterium]
MKKKKKPIELYFWALRQWMENSIMLEECFLTLKPVNIGKGDQFNPSF